MHKEATGFILADGCCMIIKQNRTRKYKDKTYNFIGYIPKVNVSQRADNLAVLNWFKDKYGGYVMRNSSFKPPHHPVYYWQLATFEGCLNLTRELLKAEIPHKKIRAVKILHEFCKLRLKMGKGGKIGENINQFEGFYTAIRKANKFSME